MGRDRVSRLSSYAWIYRPSMMETWFGTEISLLAPPLVSSSRPRSNRSTMWNLKNNQNNEKQDRNSWKTRSCALPFSSAEYNQLVRVTASYHITRPWQMRISKMWPVAVDLALNFQHNCQLNSEAIEDLIRDTDAILAVLDRLVSQYNKVDRDTSDFAKQSQRLLEEQKRAEETSAKFQKHFWFSEASEWITRCSVVPGINLVKKDCSKKLWQSWILVSSLWRHAPKLQDIDTYRRPDSDSVWLGLSRWFATTWLKI